MSHTLVNLARDAIRYYLETGKHLAVGDRPGNGPAGALFVSLHDTAQPGEEQGALRGCRGSLRPVEDTLFAEVVRQAVYAAADDPRVTSVCLEEVDAIEITVYLLGPRVLVENLEELDPARYGILVEAGYRRALLLPAISGIDTVSDQVMLTKRKASIGPDEPAEIYRFEAEILE
ncbi:MAG: AMMECR1 domain-containing protein [Chloroflexota bacterium]|nr:AMMECR1 domain-containing protein [Chloroflexota bacterium]